MEIFAIIMAGGIGARFWPRSKKKNPKQLLKIFGDNTLIQDTVERVNGICPKENIIIVTNEKQRDGVIEQLPDIPVENIIVEPFGRNTAAGIGLASVLIQKKSAANFAEENPALVTIGIVPTRPETGYGYIQIDEDSGKNDVYKVLTFAEKPNYATAVNFVKSGDFFWNSGMFIWKTETIINEIQKHMPDLFEGLMSIKEQIDSPDFQNILSNIYGQLRSVSIDYGIMEKSENVFLVKGKFNWSDVGSWEAVYELSEKDEDGNVKIGSIYTDMVVDSYIYSPEKFTAVIGVDNVIVINYKDTLLVCKRDKAQDVKNIIDYLKLNKLNDHL